MCNLANQICLEEECIKQKDKDNIKISPKLYLKSLYEDKELNLKYDKFMRQKFGKEKGKEKMKMEKSMANILDETGEKENKLNYYEQVPASLENKFKEFDKQYSPWWALKEKIAAIIKSDDRKYVTDFIKCDLIIRLVRDYYDKFGEG